MEENKEHEEMEVWASELIDLVKKQLKHWMIAFFTVLILWAGTIAGFIWYLNQYDFVSYEQDGNGNNYMNSEIEGDVHNGSEAPGTEEKEQE